ncbi:protein-glutamate O-methyltransferase CheR [Alteromonas sediminis]|uniref:protein-glutamate O-methyltransferase n=1 Tax=Alteromonas sediminis TaxID=2259342 RepID=A0A3N5Y4D3_9ALTE|nr:protein-glutamate O-methyltransferase CheR [Alteromonas sediminis]RPJ64949.1 protein-glutamate O-methyltransferase CheR [Alteromonas sediminis]
MQRKDVTDQHYSAFTAYLQTNAGIVLGEGKRYLVKSRLTSLLFETGMDDINDLIDKVLSGRDRQLTQMAIDALTTNETLWFRDNYPFDLLKSTLFASMTQKKSSLTMWSAACSSGQEPYSIAMTYKEYLQSHPSKSFRLSIVATDLSSKMIARCKLGEYDELSLSRGGLTPERRKRFFTETGEGTLKVVDDLSRLIQFKQHNLLDGRMPGQTFDMIFCRNVLIYFSPEVKAKLLQLFAASLSPGGILFLGASESITGASEYFNMVRCSPGLYYQLK